MRQPHASRIRTPDHRLKVFVSSTMAELADERRAARAAIEQLRLAPVMFEAGARAHAPQSVFEAYVDQSDIFVGVYAQSYGWVGPGMEVSGIEHELNLSTGMPRLLYFKDGVQHREPGLERMLANLRREGSVSYTRYRDAGHLESLLVDDLAALLSERFPAPAAPDPAQAKPLPFPASALLGRGREIVDLVLELADPANRLLVLTGIGGIGKTRLALAVADAARAHFATDVAFVDLTHARDPSKVPELVASALGIVERRGETSTDALVRALEGRHMLLVLDNLEQVIGAAPLVVEVIERLPELHLLVTSRIPLRVRGERVHPVEPLDVGEIDGDLAAMSQAPAVRLFVERARNASPSFRLTASNMAAVSELTRRLDGLPLAIELVAPGVRIYTPEELLARLDDEIARSDRLVDLPNRQRTLEATLQWSWDLLSPTARVVLSRLGIFSGAFTLAGASTVSALNDDSDFSDALAELTLHSLVVPGDRPDGAHAFRLLETVRMFVVKRLNHPRRTWSNLEGYLLEVLDEASAEHGAGLMSMRLLDSEVANMKALVAHRIRQGQSPGALLRASASAWVWMHVRGHARRLPDLHDVISSSAARDAMSERDWAAVDRIVAAGLFADGRYCEVGELLDRALPRLRALESPDVWGMLLNYRAVSRPFEPDGPALGKFEEAVRTLAEAGDPTAAAYASLHFALFLRLRGDHDRAQQWAREGARIALSLSDRNLTGLAHVSRAVLEADAGRFGVATEELCEAAEDYRAIGHVEGVARVLSVAGLIADASGRHRLAARACAGVVSARTVERVPAFPMVAEFETRVGDQVLARPVARREFANRSQTVVPAVTLVDTILPLLKEQPGVLKASVAWGHVVKQTMVRLLLNSPGAA